MKAEDLPQRHEGHEGREESMSYDLRMFFFFVPFVPLW